MDPEPEPSTALRHEQYKQQLQRLVKSLEGTHSSAFEKFKKKEEFVKKEEFDALARRIEDLEQRLLSHPEPEPAPAEDPNMSGGGDATPPSPGSSSSAAPSTAAASVLVRLQTGGVGQLGRAEVTVTEKSAELLGPFSLRA